ncbi:carbon-nitrogen hydrolase [Xylaria sp. CBS 124048]|nr:carbon-nitrogen hydrolase [Xylaria sp. CBS 124048]
MRIGCLQFAPQVGDVDNNLERADAILNKADPENLDLLVLPELAFTGYNFKSLRDISPFLEPTGAGITAVWARTTALKHNCRVVVGYPESADVSQRWPTSLEYYNSAIIINEDGDTCGHYRKSHLYYTDESWALEGSGFFSDPIDGIGQVAMGICMDINPYKFEAPWNAYEFAFHVLDAAANVVILSMAWLTRENALVFNSQPREPDMETLTYWITRLEPLIRAETEEEIIVIFANRTGVEDEAVYAGTSAVLGIQNGEVTVYGLLGRGDKDLLVVDTDKSAFAKLVYRPDGDSTEQNGEASGSEPHTPPRCGNSDAESNSPGALSDPSPRPECQSDSANLSSNTHRSSRSSVPIDSTTISQSNAHVLVSRENESQISTGHSRHQSQHEFPMVRQYPNVGIHGSSGDWHSPLPSENNPAHRHIVREDPELASSKSNEANESSYSVGAFTGKDKTRRSSLDQQIFARSHEANAINQKAIKNDHQLDQSDGGKRRTASPSRKHRPRRSATDPQCRSGHAPRNARNANIDDETHQNTYRSRTSPQNESPVPILEKLGVDLMVFEEEGARRPKRDSLICHVDEDDYIIMRRDTVSKRKQHVAEEQLPPATISHKAQPQLVSYRDNVGSRSADRAVATSLTQETAPKDVPSLPSLFSTIPKQVSNSHGRTASQGELATEGSFRWRDGEAIYPPAKHDVPLQKGASPSLTRPRQTERYTDSKRAGREDRTGKHTILPNRTAETSNGNVGQSFAVGSMPLVGIPVRLAVELPHQTSSRHESSVRAVSSPKKGLPMVEKTWKAMPPTPKAMVIPPEYNDDDTVPRSTRPLQKDQVPIILV